ncbi:MAG: 6-bladed beta-propeller [Tannerellaceae bacterium]|nr:6-bladed beta-propeller [Tannerellaceae bacterium]
MSHLKNEVKTIPLSELLEDFEIIKLDDRPEALVKSGMSFITDKYMGFGARFGLNMPYKLFDRKGNYLSHIGSIGQGPGEYINMYDSYIDDINDRIYILQWNATSVLVYDVNGNIYAPIPLPYCISKGIMHVDGNKERLYLGLLPFKDSGIEAVYWEQDFQGNIIQQIEPGHMAVYPDFSNEVSSYRNTTEKDFYIFYWQTRQDSLYHYDDVQKKLKPVFTIDFRNNPLMHDYGELPGHFLANVTTEINEVKKAFFRQKNQHMN